jgi:signal transduction histidine kinase
VTPEIVRARMQSPEHQRLVESVGFDSWIIAPMIARGRTLGAISVCSVGSGRRFTARDLTLIEDLARRAGMALDNARLLADMQRAVRMREDILAVVSHDLKNPLGAVQLASSVLMKSVTDERPRRQVETIHRAATRMGRLIGDLLDLASIQAGRVTLEWKPEDLTSVITEAIELHMPIAVERGIELMHEEQGSAMVLCDRERLMQVFSNLIGNALKFCRRGDRVRVETALDDQQATVSVIDNGPGISEEDQRHIFEPYWSADPSVKKSTGLGLYICKGIVEAHQGHVTVESKPGAGATFRFTLRLAPT